MIARITDTARRPELASFARGIAGLILLALVAGGLGFAVSADQPAPTTGVVTLSPGAEVTVPAAEEDTYSPDYSHGQLTIGHTVIRVASEDGFALDYRAGAWHVFGVAP